MILKDYKKALPVAAAAMITSVCSAHIDWTRPNSIDPDCIALYHINSNQVEEGNSVEVPPGLPQNRSLMINAPAGAAASVSADVAQSIFFPYSFRFNSVQELRSEGQAGGTLAETITGDLSIESRFKWHAGMTSSSLEFGLIDGLRVVITYDPANPQNDRLGIAGPLGDYRSAAQFEDWIPQIEHDGGIGNWSHAGVCIHSTGVTFNSSRQTYEYNTGSTARFYINGHLVGNFSVSAVDIAGVGVSNSSAIFMSCTTGSHVSFDEFTVWSRDWSENGDNFSPFGDGRGSGVSSIADWELY